MLGKWLSCRGWAEALCNAGVSTQGVACGKSSNSNTACTDEYGIRGISRQSRRQCVSKVIFQEWKEDAMEVSAIFVLGWCTRFATLLSSACESCKRSQLFQVCQGHKADLTMVLCPGSYKLRQIAICTIPRLVRASRQASRCAQTILQWLICSSQDKEVLFFCSAGSRP